jgi:hypothetical protein
MKGRLQALYLSGSLALSFLMTKPLMADDWNKRVDFQFNAPVEIPGKVLAPGKYVFELLDSDSDRSIVQVYSEDSNGKQSPVTMIQAIPAYIANIPDKPVIRFEERPSGSPEAIHSWFYPGEHTGWEFVYRLQLSESVDGGVKHIHRCKNDNGAQQEQDRPAAKPR